MSKIKLTKKALNLATLGRIAGAVSSKRGRANSANSRNSNRAGTSTRRFQGSAVSNQAIGPEKKDFHIYWL